MLTKISLTLILPVSLPHQNATNNHIICSITWINKLFWKRNKWAQRIVVHTCKSFYAKATQRVENMNRWIKEFSSANKTLCELEAAFKSKMDMQIINYNSNCLQSKKSTSESYTARITSYRCIENCLINLCTPYAYKKNG